MNRRRYQCELEHLTNQTCQVNSSSSAKLGQVLSLIALTEFQLEEKRVCASCLKVEMLVVPKACCDFIAEGCDTTVTSKISIF